MHTTPHLPQPSLGSSCAQGLPGALTEQSVHSCKSRTLRSDVSWLCSRSCSSTTTTSACGPHATLRARSTQVTRRQRENTTPVPFPRLRPWRHLECLDDVQLQLVAQPVNPPHGVNHQARGVGVRVAGRSPLQHRRQPVHQELRYSQGQNSARDTPA